MNTKSVKAAFFCGIASLVLSCDNSKQADQLPPTPSTMPDLPSPSSNLSKNQAPVDEIAVEAIQKSFEAYKTALLNKNGKAAVALVSQSTLKSYQEFRNLAIEAESAAVKKLSFFNRMMVLLLRHRSDYATLEKMDGAALFTHAVEQQWITIDSLLSASLSDIVANGNAGAGKLSTPGNKAKLDFQFVKEMNQWALELNGIMKSADLAFQIVAKRSGLTEDELIFSILSSATGREVSDAIWQPLKMPKSK